MKKVCTVCLIEKDIEEFGKRSKKSDDYRNDCKVCRSIYMGKYREENKNKLSEKSKLRYEENKEDIKISGLLYRQNNREKLNERSKEYNRKNKEKISLRNKEFRKNNKELVAFRKKSYYEKNKEKENKRKTQWSNNKRKSDPLYKLKCNIRSLIKISVLNVGFVKSQLKVTKTDIILGCTVQEFKKYLESKFLEGMSWDNYGSWHMDHIIPVSYAKNEEELIRLNHYTNFQPLWAFDNLSKGNRFIG